MSKNPLKTKPSTSSESFFIRPTVSQKSQQPGEKRERSNDKFFKKPSNKVAPIGQKKTFVKQQKTKQDGVKKEKKPFDKKQYRLKKYSKKYKLDEWENNRKKVIGRRYTRELKKQPTVDVQKIYEKAEQEETEAAETESSEEKREEGKKKRLNYRERIEKVQEDKEKAKEEAVKKREEKKAKIEEYRRKKTEKNRILSKKTKKGQPIMKGRLELLLQQIQEGCAKD